MAEEAFQVMISDQEYKQLKSNLKANQALKVQIAQLQLSLKKVESQSQSLQLQLGKKDVEIAFLVDVIQNVISGNAPGSGNDSSIMKSNTFQVLGQSVIEPELAKERKIKQYSQELMKKYDSTLKVVAELEQRMESQEELITKLSQMNEEKNEALLTKETSQKADDSDKNSDLEKEIASLKHQISLLKAENEEQKRQKIEQKLILQKDASNAGKSSDKLVSEAQKETTRLKKENQSAAKRLKDSNERIRDLQMEISIMKQGLGSSTFPKDQTKNKLKALIDEFARQVENNLKSVEGLSQVERNELMQYEMKELVDYIPHTISNKK